MSKSSKATRKLVKFFILLLVVPPSISERILAKVNRVQPKFQHGKPGFNKNHIRPIYSKPHYSNFPNTKLQQHKIPSSVTQAGTILLREVSTLPLKYNFSPLSPQQVVARPRPTNFNFQQTNISHIPSIPPHISSVSPMKKCKGRKNLLDDLGILSLATAVTASTFGLYTVIGNSMTSNNIGIVSGFFSLAIWLPATLITLLELSGDTIQLINNFLNGLGFINAMYGFMGVFFGTADVVASSVGETIGIISLILSIVATFPDLLDAIIELLYRTGDRNKMEHYVENYGCSVPRIFDMDGKPLYDIMNEFLVEQTNMKAPRPFRMNPKDTLQLN